MTDRLTVSFCVNDDAGNLLDVVSAVEVEGLIRLWGPAIFDGVELSGTTPIAWTIRIVDVAGVEFRHHGQRRFAGNLLWDSAEMDRAEVVRMLNYLRKRGGWSCMEAEVSLAQVWGEREITVADIERAMGS
jgi:hypothetical protein